MAVKTYLQKNKLSGMEQTKSYLSWLTKIEIIPSLNSCILALDLGSANLASLCSNKI